MRKKARESSELSLVVSASAICTEREAPPERALVGAINALDLVEGVVEACSPYAGELPALGVVLT